MTPSRTFTSPATIRRAASIAIRNRARCGIADRVPELRDVDHDETPLSAEEVAFGVARGLIRTSRPRAHFAQGA